MQPIEKTVIDKAVRKVYTAYLANPDPAKMPILEDLFNALKEQPERKSSALRPHWKSM